MSIRFVEFTEGEHQIWVNPETVRYVSPGGTKRSIIHFDSDNAVHVEGEPHAVAILLSTVD